jgi:hypothetical protein
MLFGSLAFSCLLNSSADAGERAGVRGANRKPGVVTLSRDTTYITEPLRQDGYPDYVAALGQRLSRGVTPENNSAVLFINATGPGLIGPEHRKRYFQALGIAPLPEKGGYFVELNKFVEASGPGKAGGDEQSLEKRQQSAATQQATAMTRPWSKIDFPLLAAWLAANKRPLELVVEASRRPRRYDPLIPGTGDALIGSLLPAVQQSGAVVRALAARAMLRVEEGNVDAAWRDLLACHRLARLVGEGYSLVEVQFGVTLDEIAVKGDQALLRHAKLTAARIERMGDDLAKLPPMPKVAEMVEVGQRLTYLDAVLSAARGDIRALSEISYLGADGKSSGIPGLQWLIKSFAPLVIDWDVVLRIGNTWYDRLAAACREPTRSQRARALDKFDADIKTLAESFRGRGAPSEAIPWISSKRCGQWFVTLLVPAVQPALDAQDRDTMESKLNALAFALAAYRADNGSYPERLAGLVPKYVSAIPKDLFDNDGDLRYQPTAHGYLLYSVGVNGKDDGGPGLGGTSNDDIGIRMPDSDEGHKTVLPGGTGALTITKSVPGARAAPQDHNGNAASFWPPGVNDELLTRRCPSQDAASVTRS